MQFSIAALNRAYSVNTDSINSVSAELEMRLDMSLFSMNLVKVAVKRLHAGDP